MGGYVNRQNSKKTFASLHPWKKSAYTWKKYKQPQGYHIKEGLHRL